MTDAAVSSRILLLGYGNPARGDDGLGPACAAAAASWNLPRLTVDQDYQLKLEDAAAVAAHAVVIFVDAAAEGPAPFAFLAVEPAPLSGFTTHALSPAQLLEIAHRSFGAAPEARLLAIRGYRFDHFCEELSPPAAANLRAAADFLKGYIAALDLADLSS